jgi:hypothetical protein
MPEAQNDRRTSAATNSWFLKIDDGSVFGPVPTADLRGWAEQGRIAPGNQLSQDKKTWIPAETLPDLQMQWMVQLRDDTLYGPLNIKALVDLVRDGTVPPGAVLTHKDTRRTSTIQKELPELAQAAPAAPAADEVAKLKKQFEEEKEQIGRAHV